MGQEDQSQAPGYLAEVSPSTCAQPLRLANAYMFSSDSIFANLADGEAIRHGSPCIFLIDMKCCLP